MAFIKQLNIESVSKNVPVSVDVANNSRSVSLNIRAGGGSGGTKDYENLCNKPSINGVELTGNKTSSEIHVQHEMSALSEWQIDEIIFGG